MKKRSSALVAVLLGLCGLAACGGGAGAADGQRPTPEPPPDTGPPSGWTRLADMPFAVAKFGVAALDGRIHVVGGYDTRRGQMVYDIASNSWRSAAPLPSGSDNLVALAAEGKVHAIGGEASKAYQVYDPAAGVWTRGPTLPTARFASAGAVLAGRLHVVAGWNTSNSASASLSSQSVFDLANQRWGSAAPLATARNAAAAAVLGDELVVVGGRAPGIRLGDQSSLDSAEIYSAATDQWRSTAPLPTARASLALVALGGRLYALGGESTAAGGPTLVGDAVERYDPATRTWTALPPMPYRSHGLGAVAVGTAIYVMGGFGAPSDAVGSESAALYRYVPPK